MAQLRFPGVDFALPLAGSPALLRLGIFIIYIINWIMGQFYSDPIYLLTQAFWKWMNGLPCLMYDSWIK